MIELTSRQLHGFSRSKAECYGKPNVLARYTGTGVKDYRHDDAVCPLCHRRMVTNTHHQPDRKIFTLPTPYGVHILRPALFGVCGSGTTGCHGLIEANVLRIEWEWFDDESARMWWGGEMLKHMAPHNAAIYRHGCWVITDTIRGDIERIGGEDGTALG